MKFTCNGTITKWIYGGTNIRTNRNQFPELQIWRKHGDNNYTKVGFSSVNPSTSSSDNVYELLPQNQVKFQQGDIFGIHVPQNSQSCLRLLHLRQNNGPINQYVSTNDALTEITQALTSDENGFPLVTAEISKFIFYYM